MRIEQLLDKKEQLQLLILRQLILQGGQFSATELRKEVGLSRNAFEQYVSDLEYVCQISKIPLRLFYEGTDLVLHIPPEHNLNDIVELFVADSINYQILDFLLRHKEFTIVQLVNELMISESSVFRKIKELNRLLAEFGLQIKNGQFLGEEAQIRYFYNQVYSFYPSECQNTCKLHQKIKTLFARWSRCWKRTFLGKQPIKFVDGWGLLVND